MLAESVGLFNLEKCIDSREQLLEFNISGQAQAELLHLIDTYRRVGLLYSYYYLLRSPLAFRSTAYVIKSIVISANRNNS